MTGGAAALKAHFGRALASDDRLHVAAHSHHPWPDVTRDAHLAAWDLAAAQLDDKWDTILRTVVPEAQGHVARRLGLRDPATVAFAPNTHELLVRITSALPRPFRVLTTDAEFHSAARQLARWEEAGVAHVDRVPAESFATFPERFVAAMRPEHGLVLVSHVFFDSGYVVPDLAQLVDAVPSPDALVVVDGYHAFMAVPTDLGAIASRAFYLAGGYKYAMAGEGACFAHAPAGYATRPVDTGWFAAFGALADAGDGRVGYPADAGRLAGSTTDPSGLFRFNAVQRWLDGLGVDVPAIHAHVGALQTRLLAALDAEPLAALPVTSLVPGRQVPDRGHFLTFRTDRAPEVEAALAARGVVADRRGERLRLGFGVYHDDDDVDRLAAELAIVARHA
ncbi:aminotransferase class V [Beutenbergia cavernae DSM 12333]|uniref:Aminotransferase class V n=1 Tax=Beutenbergia cavernae (strain ATCC BAA-8 / DSM 12333 / CCUG 43141 / JCM 11478 / NBRC 16432 / NCIMB 13614 / HKI 0122) TaxID=471853 RepID=C5C036_BEUC1|nr:aminotransferase class V-fold PLP-dependent enzyme [Beutenbergia cavernae]ACQ79222.1 aminotransferase class V [Beutenbergia cavernae DSM 12333]